MHEESKSNQIREETARILGEAYVREDLCHQSDTLRYGFLAEDIKENWTLLSQQRGLSNCSLYKSVIQIYSETTATTPSDEKANSKNKTLIVFRSGDDIHSFVNKRYHHSVALKKTSQPFLQKDTTCGNKTSSDLHTDEGEQYSTSKTIPGSGYTLKLKTLFGGFASTENRALYKFHTNYNDLVHELEEASEFNEKDSNEDQSYEEEESSIEEYSEEEDSISLSSDVSKPATHLLGNLLLMQNSNGQEEFNLEEQLEQEESNVSEPQDKINDIFGGNYKARMKKRDSLFALRHLTDQQPIDDAEMFDDSQFAEELEALMILEEEPLTEGPTTTDDRQFFEDQQDDESIKEETLLQVIKIIDEEISEESDEDREDPVDIAEETKTLHEAEEVFHQSYHAEITELKCEEPPIEEAEMEEPDDSIVQRKGHKEAKSRIHPTHQADLTNMNEENSVTEDEFDSHDEDVEYVTRTIRITKTIVKKKELDHSDVVEEIDTFLEEPAREIQTELPNESHLPVEDETVRDSTGEDDMIITQETAVQEIVASQHETNDETDSSSDEVTTELVSIMNTSATTEEWAFIEDRNEMESTDVDSSQEDIKTLERNYSYDDIMQNSFSQTIHHLGGYYCDPSDLSFDDFESEVIFKDTDRDVTTMNNLSYYEVKDTHSNNVMDLEESKEDVNDTERQQDLTKTLETKEEKQSVEMEYMNSNISVNETTRLDEIVISQTEITNDVTNSEEYTTTDPIPQVDVLRITDYTIGDIKNDLYSNDGTFFHEEPLDNSFSRTIYHESGYYCDPSDLWCDDYESEVIFKETNRDVIAMNDLSYYEVEDTHSNDIMDVEESKEELNDLERQQNLTKTLETKDEEQSVELELIDSNILLNETTRLDEIVITQTEITNDVTNSEENTITDPIPQEDLNFITDHTIGGTKKSLYSNDGRFFHEESLDNSFSRMIYHASGYYCDPSDLWCDDYESEVIFKDHSEDIFTALNDLSYYEKEDETNKNIAEEIGDSMIEIAAELTGIYSSEAVMEEQDILDETMDALNLINDENPDKNPLSQSEAIHILDDIIDEAEKDLYSQGRLIYDEKKIIDHEVGCIWIAPVLNYDLNEVASVLSWNHSYQPVLHGESFYEVEEGSEKVVYKRKTDRGNLYQSLRSWFDHHSKFSAASDSTFSHSERCHGFDNRKNDVGEACEERYFKIVMSQTKYSKVSVTRAHLASFLVAEKNRSVFENHQKVESQSRKVESNEEMCSDVTNYEKFLVENSKRSTKQRSRVRREHFRKPVEPSYTFPSIDEYDTDLILEAEEDFEEESEEYDEESVEEASEEIHSMKGTKLQNAHSHKTFNSSNELCDNMEFVSSNELTDVIHEQQNVEESFIEMSNVVEQVERLDNGDWLIESFQESNHQEHFNKDLLELNSHNEKHVINTSDQIVPPIHVVHSRQENSQNNLINISLQEEQMQREDVSKKIPLTIQGNIVANELVEMVITEGLRTSVQTEKFHEDVTMEVSSQEIHFSSSWVCREARELSICEKMSPYSNGILTDWGTIVHSESGPDISAMDTCYHEYEVEYCSVEHNDGPVVVADDLSFYDKLPTDVNQLSKKSSRPSNDQGGGGSNSHSQSDKFNKQENGNSSTSNRKGTGTDKKKRRSDNNRRGRQKVLGENLLGESERKEKVLRSHTVESESWDVMDISYDSLSSRPETTENSSFCTDELYQNGNNDILELSHPVSPVQGISEKYLRPAPIHETPMTQLNKYHISISHFLLSTCQHQTTNLRIWFNWSLAVRDLFSKYSFMTHPNMFPTDYEFYKRIVSLCQENDEVLRKEKLLRSCSDDEERRVLFETQTSWNSSLQMVHQKGPFMEEVCRLYRIMEKIQLLLKESDLQCYQETLLAVDNEQPTAWGTVTPQEYIALLNNSNESLKEYNSQLNFMKETIKGFKHVDWDKEIAILQERVHQQSKSVNRLMSFCTQTLLKQNEISSLLRQNEKDIEICRIQLRDLSRRREQLSMPFHEMGCEYEKCKFSFEVVDLRMKRTRVMLDQSVSNSHPFINQRQYLERRIETLCDIIRAYRKELMQMTVESHVFQPTEKKNECKSEQKTNHNLVPQTSSIRRWNLFWKIVATQLFIILVLLLLWTSFFTANRRESSILNVILPRISSQNVGNS